MPDLPDLSTFSTEQLDDWLAALTAEAHRRQVLAEAAVRVETVQHQAERQIDAIAAEYLAARDGDIHEDNPLPWVQPTGAHDAYPKDWTVAHGGRRWRSLVAANVHEPGVSGWREISDGVPDWVQPTGAHDAYDEGDEVMHVDRHWVSTRTANVWEPGTTDAGWDEVKVDVPDPEPPTGPDPDPEPPTDPEPTHPEGYVGTWNSTTRYEVGHVVDHQGRYYRCKVAHGAEYQGTWAPPAHAVWDDLGPV